METVKFHFGKASAKLVPLAQDLYMVKDVWSEIRRQGHASAVMRQMTYFADRYYLTLLLSVQPYDDRNDSKALDVHQLEVFYTKFGFERQPEYPKRPYRMIRRPQKLPKD